MRYRRPLSVILAAGLLAFGCQTRLKLAPEDLPAAKLGAPYLAKLAFTNAETPVFSVRVSRGHLPTGLRLTHAKDSAEVTIEGTPAAKGHFRFRIESQAYGTNFPGGAGDQAFDLAVE